MRLIQCNTEIERAVKMSAFVVLGFWVEAETCTPGCFSAYQKANREGPLPRQHTVDLVEEVWSTVREKIPQPTPGAPLVFKAPAD